MAERVSLPCPHCGDPVWYEEKPSLAEPCPRCSDNRIAEREDLARLLCGSPTGLCAFHPDCTCGRDVQRILAAGWCSPAAMQAERAAREAAELARGGDTGIDCCVCGFRIYGTFIGMGDGSGKRFGHVECYYRKCAEAAEQEANLLREKLQTFTAKEKHL